MQLFSMILLQVVQMDTAQAVSQVAATTATDNPELNVFELIKKGGVLMIPLFLVSFVAIALFVERYLYIRRVLKPDPAFMVHIKDALKNRDIALAQQYCAKSTHPIARLIERAITRLGSPVGDIESVINNMTNVEISKMEKNMGVIAAVAAVAPMLGFLGTVIGMIKSFYNISLAHDISIGIIASGIYVKMITSASGLIIGIAAYMMYTFLNNMIDRAVTNMEMTSMDFLDLLYKPIE